MTSPEPTPAARLPVPWPVLASGLVAVGLLILYPPFRIVPRNPSADGGGARTAGAPLAPAFSATAFAERFWSEQLQPAAAGAPQAAPVLAALQRDPVAAAQAHAHRVGIGGTAHYFLQAQGRIIAIERSRLLVDVDGRSIAIRTGPVFGNAVRDGTGLLDVNQVPGLAEFNALSAELNRLVEARIQPALKSAQVGATLRFAGCAEAPETAPAAGPVLTFVPVQAEVHP